MLQLRLNTAKHIVIIIIKGQRERRKLGMLRCDKGVRAG